MRHKTKFVGSIGLLTTIAVLTQSCASSVVDVTNKPSDDVYSIREARIPENLRTFKEQLLDYPTRITGALIDDPISPEYQFELNEIRKDYYSTIESEFYTQDRERVNFFRSNFGLDSLVDSNSNSPKLCLALSGGGIRSAAFNIGVMQGINENILESLEGVDIVSSVSGGSYANGWLLAQRIQRETSLESILSEQGSALEYLEENSEWFVVTPASAFAAILTYPFQILLALTNLFPGFRQVDIAGIGYYTELNGLFFQNENDTNIVRIPLEDVADYVSELEHPFPIFNATFQSNGSACSNDSEEDFNDLDRSVFEITPIRAGSETLGFSDFFTGDQSSDLTGAVMVSGAAIDDPSGGIICFLRRIVGIETGVTYRGFVTSSPVLPENINAEGHLGRIQDVHVIDGGYSDNSGIYPLVKRQCQTILVVDAEHDPTLRFNSYLKVRDFLRDSVGLSYKVDTIDNFLSSKPENNRFIADQFDVPVSTGTIDGFVADNEPEKQIDVIYVKLSIDNSIMQEYPDEVIRFIQNDSHVGCVGSGFRERCQFPQQSTAHQAFSKEEFRAYRLLGKHLIEDIVESQNR